MSKYSSELKIYKDDAEYQREKNKWNNSRLRSRNPAGAREFQLKEALYLTNKAREEEAAANVETTKSEVDTVAETKTPFTPTPFTPTPLDTGGSEFINVYGGNQNTPATGLAAVKRAEAAGLTIRDIQQMGADQGFSFGPRAQDYFEQKKGPDIENMFASQIEAMQKMFSQSIQNQAQQFQQMQQSQDKRMEALQQQMQQASVAQQQRPEVAGVKMAESSAGTPMQIARRGVSGAFGRRGMRISSLNVGN